MIAGVGAECYSKARVPAELHIGNARIETNEMSNASPGRCSYLAIGLSIFHLRSFALIPLQESITLFALTLRGLGIMR